MNNHTLDTVNHDRTVEVKDAVMIEMPGDYAIAGFVRLDNTYARVQA